MVRIYVAADHDRAPEVVTVDLKTRAVSSSSGGFSTGDIPAGGSASFTAPDRPGTFPYICSIHQYMSGTLTVS